MQSHGDVAKGRHVARDVVVRAAAAQPARPTHGGAFHNDLPNSDEYSFAVACCCCCVVAGQLWQRVLRKPWWHCVVVTVVLWFFAGAWLASDAVSPADYNASKVDWSDGVTSMAARFCEAPSTCRTD